MGAIGAAAAVELSERPGRTAAVGDARSCQTSYSPARAAALAVAFQRG